MNAPFKQLPPRIVYFIYIYNSESFSSHHSVLDCFPRTAQHAHHVFTHWITDSMSDSVDDHEGCILNALKPWPLVFSVCVGGVRKDNVRVETWKVVVEPAGLAVTWDGGSHVPWGLRGMWLHGFRYAWLSEHCYCIRGRAIVTLQSRGVGEDSEEIHYFISRRVSKTERNASEITLKLPHVVTRLKKKCYCVIKEISVKVFDICEGSVNTKSPLRSLKQLLESAKSQSFDIRFARSFSVMVVGKWDNFEQLQAPRKISRSSLDFAFVSAHARSLNPGGTDYTLSDDLQGAVSGLTLASSAVF